MSKITYSSPFITLYASSLEWSHFGEQPRLFSVITDCMCQSKISSIMLPATIHWNNMIEVSGEVANWFVTDIANYISLTNKLQLTLGDISTRSYSFFCPTIHRDLRILHTALFTIFTLFLGIISILNRGVLKRLFPMCSIVRSASSLVLFAPLFGLRIAFPLFSCGLTVSFADMGLIPVFLPAFLALCATPVFLASITSKTLNIQDAVTLVTMLFARGNITRIYCRHSLLDLLNRFMSLGDKSADNTLISTNSTSSIPQTSLKSQSTALSAYHKEVL